MITEDDHRRWGVGDDEDDAIYVLNSETWVPKR
jgi:hypothetical protein